MEFKVGHTYHIKIHPAKTPYKIHILAIVDENMVVYKWYGRHKQYWHYVVENKEMLEYKIK